MLNVSNSHLRLDFWDAFADNARMADATPIDEMGQVRFG